MKKKTFSVVAWGTLLLAGSSLLSRLLGVVREYVFAKIFGVGEGGGIFAIDAYFAAFRLPDLLYTFLITGALSTAFIPIYVRLKKQGQGEADHFTGGILTLLLLVFLLLTVFIWLFAPLLIPLLVPGFSSELHGTTIQLTRIMLLSPLFLGVSSLFQGVENAHKKFLGIALAPLLYNFSIILAAWFWGEKFGVYALAWGVVVGAVLHFIVQFPGVFSTPFRLQPHFAWKGKAFRDFFFLSLPRLFGVSVAQLGLFVDTFIASLLGLGSLSVFNYALNLHSLPHGVVAVSLSMAIFPDLSEESAEENPELFVQTLRRSTHFLLFWVLPMVFAIFFLRREIIDLILTGGAFTESAAERTALTLGIFIWAALGQSLVPLFARAFYALHDSKRPVIAAFAAVILNTTLSLILTQTYGLPVWALAISAVASGSLNALLLLFFLSRRLKVKILDFFDLKKMLPLIPMNALMLVLLFFLRATLSASLWLELLLFSVLGAGLYLGLGFLTKTIPSLRKA